MHMAAIVGSPTTLRTWSVTMDKPRTIEDDAACCEALYRDLLAHNGRLSPETRSS